MAQWSRIALLMQETQVLFLGRRDLLQKETANHSSIDWEIPCTEDPGGLYIVCELAKELDMTELTSTQS